MIGWLVLGGVLAYAAWSEYADYQDLLSQEAEETRRLLSNGE